MRCRRQCSSFFIFASTDKKLSLKGGAWSATFSLWLMESGGLCQGLVLGCCEDLFSVGFTTVAWTVKNFVCFAFHFWNRSWIIHREALSKEENFLFCLKKRCFLLLRTFYTHKFWTVDSCEQFLTPCSWCFTGKVHVIVSTFTSFPSFSLAGK